MDNEVSEIEKDGHKKIIFFDGVCNLCNFSVQTVIRFDKKNNFYFAALQSKFATEFFAVHNFVPKSDSILYWDGKKMSEQSTAALKISKSLSFPVNLFLFFWIFPKPVRDWGYKLIARNRYKWFGKQDSCMIPTPDLKRRFLDSATM